MELPNKYEKIIDELQSIYENSKKPFAVAYSSGKDSSVCLDLVIRMITRLDNPSKPIYVQNSDTLLEMDMVNFYTEDSLKRLKIFCDERGLPIIIKRVRPITEETILSLIIGKGYKISLSDNKWCTDRTKIRPQERLHKEYEENSPNGIIAVIGSRKEESKDRKERLEKSTIEGQKLKKHEIKNWDLLAPIEDLTEKDIWEYLANYSLEWIDYMEIGRMYEEAADNDAGECRSLLEGSSGEKPNCSKSSRFGCYLCFSQYSRDATLTNLGEKYAYLKLINSFRNWLYEEGGLTWKNRRVYRNDNRGKVLYNKGNKRDFMVSPSGYTLEFRKEILKRFWKLSCEVKKNRKDRHLILEEELIFIQNEWLKEGDIECTVEKIIGYKLKGLNTRLQKLSLVVLALYTLDVKNNNEVVYDHIPFFNKEISPRLVANVIDECISNKKTDEEILKLFIDISNSNYFDKRRNKAFNEFLKLKTINKKFFPSEEEVKIIKKEWENDQVSFNTYCNNELYKRVTKPEDTPFSLDGSFNDEFKKNQKIYKEYETAHAQYEEYLAKDRDVTACESISLEEQIAWLYE